MMEKLKKLYMYIFLFSCLTIGVYAKGTLKVKTVIEPYKTTKKYNNGKTLLLDAGALNSNSSISEIKVTTVIVEMQAVQSNNGNNGSVGIEGDFNLPFSLKKLENLGEKKLTANTLKKYKNGSTANMDIYVKNIKILDKKIHNENINNDTYLFIAYPEEETNGANKLGALKYSFDLYLKVSGIKTGDIIRKDVTTGINSGAAEDAIGRIKDIIKDQFLELQK